MNKHKRKSMINLPEDGKYLFYLWNTVINIQMKFQKKVLILLIIAISLQFLFIGCRGLLDPEEPGNLVPKTVIDDLLLPRIEINETVLHAETFGDSTNPIIIMLHGGPGADYKYMRLLSELSKYGYFVIFWDQRGAGLSQRHNPDAISMEIYREDLKQVIEYYTSTPNQPIVFIGHSWGAMYATYYINEYGDYGGRIKGAVLSEPGAFTCEQLKDYLKKAMSGYNLTSEQLNDLLWLPQFISATDHAKADYILSIQGYGGLPSEHNDPNNPAPHWRMGAIVANTFEKMAKDDFDFTTQLTSFPNKVLFLRGELNELMPLEHQQKLASYYPVSEIITINGTGHSVVWEKSDIFIKYVYQYLEEINFH